MGREDTARLVATIIVVFREYGYELDPSHVLNCVKEIINAAN